MYTAYFGLRELPFNITPDPRFVYPDPGHKEAYASLLYGIRERKGCIALVGEAGTGKTTLLHRVMRDLETTIHTAFFYNTTLTFDELLDFVCSEFSLPVKTERRLEKLLALKQFLLARRQEGGTGVLIIDEAHLLADAVLENLRLLSNMETPNEKLLQLVLVGQPRLEKKLNQPELRQLKQRMVIRCWLDRLKARDVGPFIYHRLRVAGCDRQDVFTPEAIQRIAVYSEGIPRLISTICDNALLTAYAAMQSIVSAAIIEEVAYDLRLTQAEAQDGRENPSEEEAVAWRADQERELTAERHDVQAATHSTATIPRNGMMEDDAPPTLAAEASQSWPRWLTWAGIGFSLVLLFLVGSGRIFPLQTSAYLANLNVGDSPAPIAQKKGELVRPESAPPSQDLSALHTTEPQTEGPRNVGDSPAPIGQQKGELVRPESTPPSQDLSVLHTTEPQIEGPREESPKPALLPQASDFQTAQREGQLVTIARGDTISAIVLKMYGTYNVLAFDLLKEFNSHIEDLDRIAIGTQVWLPFLTRELLLRQQADGSYHLIIGAFHMETAAQRVVRTARRAGYAATIMQRRMSGTRLLHRVELEGLQDLTAVDRAWNVVGKGKM